VELAVETIAPRWTGTDAAKIKLGDDVIAEGGTYYGDSSGPRRQNVELASSRLTGWLVPPGGVFSYAENIGPIDLASGYETGYGIVEQDGQFITAPVIGGGICQVSTTIFHAAFWAGLPIEERYQHPYYLRTYGEAVSGLPGLDAMVNIERTGRSTSSSATRPATGWPWSWSPTARTSGPASSARTPVGRSRSPSRSSRNGSRPTRRCTSPTRRSCPAARIWWSRRRRRGSMSRSRGRSAPA
jgi:hypothetical protein